MLSLHDPRKASADGVTQPKITENSLHKLGIGMDESQPSHILCLLSMKGCMAL